MLKSAHSRNDSKNGIVVCEVAVKATSEANQIEGMASTFQRDLDDDIIEPGSFKTTVEERVKAGRVPLFDSHRWTAATTIGTVTHAEETEKGLFFRAKLSEAPSAQEIKLKLIEGHLKFVSIGFSIIKATWEELNENGGRKFIRHITELKLWEVSVVPIPANEGARISSVKEFLRGPSFDEIAWQSLVGEVDVDQVQQSMKALADRIPPGRRLDVLQSIAAQYEAHPQKASEPETPALAGSVSAEDLDRFSRLREQLEGSAN